MYPIEQSFKDHNDHLVRDSLRIDRGLQRKPSCEALPKMDNYNKFTVEIGLGRHSPDQLHLAIWLN